MVLINVRHPNEWNNINLLLVSFEEFICSETFHWKIWFAIHSKNCADKISSPNLELNDENIKLNLIDLLPLSYYKLIIHMFSLLKHQNERGH